MHIPDGFLDTRTALTTTVLAAGTLGYALRHARQNLSPRKVPLLGLAAAFVFAAQMINFPVLGGTSGHVIGATMTAILLGPSAAIIVIASVLIVQCLLFADGGITALGANILNMGLISGIGGWCVYWLLTRLSANQKWNGISAGIAAWIGTVAASIACSAELSASHTTQWSQVLPLMAGIHMLIGIGEALITALVLITVSRTRPELIGVRNDHATIRHSLAPVIVYGMVASLGIAMFMSQFASELPDGLDRSAEDLEFADRGHAITPAPMAEYSVKQVPVESISLALAGGVGTLVVFAVSAGLSRLLSKNQHGHAH